MKIVEMTDQEIAVSRELLNLAVKAGGLNAAPAALAISRKLAAAKDAPHTVYEQPPDDGREYHSE